MLHDAVAPDQPARTVGLPADEQLETGPVPAEQQQLHVLPATWPTRVARHPGVLAVLVTLAVAVASWRGLLGATALTRGGLVGGELTALTTDAAGLWHGYLDGWHGAGLGSAGESAPYLAVLAGLAWLVGHLPFVDPDRLAGGRRGRLVAAGRHAAVRGHRLRRWPGRDHRPLAPGVGRRRVGHPRRPDRRRRRRTSRCGRGPHRAAAGPGRSGPGGDAVVRDRPAPRPPPSRSPSSARSARR